MARVLFFALGAVHLLALAFGIPAVDFTTKALLMPVLAWWLHRQGGARLMVAGLLLSTGGDVALEFDGFFIVGMVFFTAAGRRRWAIVGVYAVLWAVLVVLLWPGLGDLQIPVTVYSLLLTATAVVSAAYGPRTGVGGALFLVSDSLIAFRIADMELPMHGLLVMLTYMAAQYLLASGSLARSGGRSPVPA